jgi:translation initiation factor 2 beta subunit (eIF-2beta)/eIF-5
LATTGRKSITGDLQGGNSSRMIGRVTIYFVRCKTCKEEIRLESDFNKIFQAFLDCSQCGKRHFYVYEDIRERRDTDAATQL